MSRRSDSSAASAARFFKLRGDQPVDVAQPTQRVLVVMSTATLEELISCVRTTIKLHETIGAEVPHITKVALHVLMEHRR